MSRHQLTLESTYCQDWTVEDALRELIQNALDTGTKTKVDCYNGNIWEISDSGNGMELSDFLIGRTSKRNDANVIGQFGEGAPIGCLVLARNNRKIQVKSKGKSYNFSFEHDEAWGGNLLTIEVQDYPHYTGTTVLVECTNTEMANTTDKFLKFKPQQVLAKYDKMEILSAPGNIYVNGLLVTHVESLFGYNFRLKSLVNRDRNAVGMTEIRHAVSQAMTELDKTALMKYIIQFAAGNDQTSRVECDIYFFINRKSLWKKALKDLYGAKVCLADNPMRDLTAIERGWTVLDLTYSMKQCLRNIIPSSLEIGDNKRKFVAVKSLEVGERQRLSDAKEVAEKIATIAELKFPRKIKIYTQKLEGTGIEGGVCFDDNTIGINRAFLKHPRDIVGIIVHEAVHMTTHNYDNTRAFENDLTSVIGILAAKIFALE